MSSTLEQIKPSLEMQPAFSETEHYRTISRSAVIALILSIVSLLAFFVSWMLVLPVVALVLGLTALSTIRRYPEEYTGAGAALAAVGISTGAFLLAATWHVVDYATEVPEGESRHLFHESPSESAKDEDRDGDRRPPPPQCLPHHPRIEALGAWPM